MNLKNVKDIMTYARYVNKAVKTDKYIKLRFDELTAKGFPEKKALEMITFEYSTSQILSIGATKASEGACFTVGAEVGAEIGAFGGPAGAFAGAGIGGASTMWVCGKGIDYTTEKGIQKFSEFLWSSYKHPTKQAVDLSKLKTYISQEPLANSKGLFYRAVKPRDAVIENPKNLKYFVDTRTGEYTNVPKSWQNYYNQPKDFKSLYIEKQLSLKNPTVSGISGGADNSLTPMQIKYPTIKINPSTSSWLGKLGDALSAVGKLAGAVAGATGGKINATKSVSGIVIPHYSDYTDQIIVPQFNDPAIHHTGGKISGKDEVMAILRGGETVRTEAQERELQEEKYKELMNFIGPMLQEKEQKPKTIAEAYDPNNKVPVLLNKTTQDEELIISIIAQAWKSNRLGFRNVLRYE